MISSFPKTSTTARRYQPRRRLLGRPPPRNTRPSAAAMPSVSAFASSSSALLRGPPARVRRLLVAAATRAHSSAAGDGSRARGGLPRFHTPSIPSSKVKTLPKPSATCPPPHRHSVERLALFPGGHAVGVISQLYLIRLLHLMFVCVGFPR